MKLKRPHNLWIDMDGVLCNFHKAAYEAWQVPFPVNDVVPYDSLLQKLNCDLETFFARCDADDRFWHNLEPYPWTSHMFQFLDAEFPNWRILTSATFNPLSCAGKMHWVERYLGRSGISKLTMVHTGKAHICAPGDFLVDDQPRNCVAWRQAGGHVFQMVDYTPDCEHGFTQLEQLKSTLLTWKQEIADLNP